MNLYVQTFYEDPIIPYIRQNISEGATWQNRAKIIWRIKYCEYHMLVRSIELQDKILKKSITESLPPSLANTNNLPIWQNAFKPSNQKSPTPL